MKGLILVLMVSWITHTSFAQDTIYVNKYTEWVNKENAIEYAVATKIGQEQIKVKYYALDGKLKRVENYQVYNEKQRIRNGNLVQFYPDGKRRREEIYDKDQCVEGKLWAEDGSELPFKPYYKAPEFPGGKMNFARKLAATIQYPSEARQQKIEGRVILQFIIDLEGRITNPEVLVSAHPILDEAALNTIKKVSKKSVWTPAKIEGESIPTYCVMPAHFRLP
ncbi:energy transducer TonB [Bacteroides sp.]|uniref:energy transducer TonB n=1 Tax=Bacteroides sp. TaxID=29523 RepID=UPI0026344A13|nr:energy transducer TonB [Bacteroides sp.]MDD3039222.1 energy transducer TonB [Bacteroides sp.]